MSSEHLVENHILGALEAAEQLDSLELSRELEQKFADLIHNHQELHSVLLSLVGLHLIELENKSQSRTQLTEEGTLYLNEGTPEYKFGQIVAENPGKPLKEIQALFADRISSLYTKPIKNPAQLAGAALGKAKALKYVEVKGTAMPGDLSVDKNKDVLATVAANPESVNPKELNELKKRGLVEQVTVNWFTIKKGESYVKSMSLLRRKVAMLTEEMVKSGEWENVDFAPLNFEALGARLPSGHEHPLLKVRYEFRRIFLEMGFEEMDTSRWVESSFWNFDSLFQGQQHPCRDMHDTFFLDRPMCAQPIEDKEYFGRVKKTHETGGNGSIARKFFSIDRVYRNETIDATHLAEFHQVEGFVIDRNLSIGDLMSYVKDFFGRIGLHEIEFKPAYNPYTEPSMEIFAKHEGLGKWIEVGNSGMFRPEMLDPMGIPSDWSVVAWGFSLERPTMIEYKIDKISSLEGPNVSLDLVENVPIARLTF